MTPFRAARLLSRHYHALAGMRAGPLLLDRFMRRYTDGERWVRLTWGRKTPVDSAAPPAGVLPDVSGAAGPWFAGRFPQAMAEKVAAAEQICRHEFEFLGTGPASWGDPIDWHRDMRSGYRWPVRFYTRYGPDLTPGLGIDVKIPWEMSRLHHLVTLGQAWWLTRRRHYADEFFAQWESWLTANPWLHGINWTNPMEAAVRAVNLLWAAALFAEAPQWTHEREMALARTLWQHGIFIERNLEVGVEQGRLSAGNHYLADACGLALLGVCCPHLPGAAGWRQAGVKALTHAMDRMVLPDGVFFESSTAYHRLAMECFLVPALLARRSGHEMPPTYWQGLERMGEVILHLTRPDGCVPQIGDGDDGRLLILSGYPRWVRHDHRYLLAAGAVLFRRADFKAASATDREAGDGSPHDSAAEQLFWLLGRAGLEEFDALPSDPAGLDSRALPHGGLYVIRSRDNRDYAVIRTTTSSDARPAGQEPGRLSLSLPLPTAHMHNDALSIELWVDGRPMFVDPGTYCYTCDPVERDRDRSTRSHSTVMVDEVEINRMLEGEPFRLVPDAAARVVEWRVGDDEVRLVAEHTGYARLAAPVVHRRTVRFHVLRRAWTVEDVLVGLGTHTATWHWHCGTECEPVVPDEVVHLSHCQMTWTSDDPLALRILEGRRAPGYGRSEPIHVLAGSVNWTDRCRSHVHIARAVASHAVRPEVGAYERAH